MSTFTSSTFLGAAGRMQANSAVNWATVRGLGSANIGTFAGSYEVDGLYSAPNWEIQRVFLPIDTSSIPTNATITAVTLNFNARYEGGATGTIIHLIQTTQSNTGTITAGDFDLVSFTTGGSVATNNSTLTAKSITGNSTALTWITKGGVNLLGLISQNDQANSDPNGGTQNWCTVTSPELVVEYTVPSSGFFAMF